MLDELLIIGWTMNKIMDLERRNNLNRVHEPNTTLQTSSKYLED